MLNKSSLCLDIIRFGAKCVTICRHRPGCFPDQSLGIYRLCDGMYYQHIRGTEIAGNIATVFLDLTIDVGYIEVPNLVVRGNKIILEVLPYTRV